MILKMPSNNLIKLSVLFLIFSQAACVDESRRFEEEPNYLEANEPLTPEQEAFLKAYQHKEKKCHSCMANN